MSWRRNLAVAMTVVGGCAELHGDAGDAVRGKADVSAGDRQVLGVASDYPADPALSAQEGYLFTSQQARRKTAWQIVARVLASAPIAETKLDVEGIATVPRWQTWYDRNDVERMFKKLYLDLGEDGRRRRAPFAAHHLDAIAEWNAALVGVLDTWPEERYLEYLESIQDGQDLLGVGAGHRVSYSPALVRHLYENYARTFACLADVGSLPQQQPGLSEENFTWCFDREFPIDAVAIKADWRRAEFGLTLPAYDTSATTLAGHLAGDADWGDGERALDPGPDQIHTIEIENGNTYRLAALHIMTKELRHWYWITLWWSDQPERDFGADRPSEIAELPGAWRNYKMCAVTAFDEGDEDPRGGMPGTLGDALAAVHTAGAGSSWCSNPYLELGAGNAATNCIGCHQHAGTDLDSAVIASSPEFPSNGRTELRRNFPSDYLWALVRGDELGRLIADEIEFYDEAD
jgi:hypothetical protein